MKVGLKFIKPDKDSILAFVDACKEIMGVTHRYNFTFLVPESILKDCLSSISNFGFASHGKSHKLHSNVFNIILDCNHALVNIDDSKKVITAKLFLSKALNLDTSLNLSLKNRSCVVEGVLDPCDGYGYATQNLILALDSLGVETSFIPTRTANESLASPVLLAARDRGYLESKNYVLFHMPKIFDTYHRMTQARKSIFTMWESTQIPKTWVPMINNNYDQLLVPSQFCLNAFSSSGVSIPIEIVKLGVNVDDWPLLERSDNRPFTFLFYANGSHDRKNTLLTIKAFETAFDLKDNVRLLLKLKDPLLQNPKKNILQKTGNFSHDEMLALLKESDCLLFPSSGEGSGQPPREAMSTGIPAVVLNWSGLAEIADESFNYVIDVSSTRTLQLEDWLVPANGSQRLCGELALLNFKALVEKMRYIFNHQDEAKAKGVKCAEFIRKNLSNKDCVESKLPAFIKVKPKIGFISSWKIKCGIAIYTEHLVNALEKQGYEVIVYPQTMNFETIFLEVIKDGVDILNIEYEPALYHDLNGLLDLMKKLKNRGVKVYLTPHSEPSHLDRLILNSTDVIFHKDSPRLHSMGKKIPMGLPVYLGNTDRKALRESYSLPVDAKIITTTGFMFKWKNFPGIIEHFVSYLRKDESILLQLLTSYNDIGLTECSAENEKIRSVISKHGLENRIIHKTEFLSQKELSERLYLSDIGYLWSAIETSSSSAAGKEFITSRLPLVATRSSHYHDLISGVVKTPIDERVFVETIISTLYNPVLLGELRSKLEVEYNELNYNATIRKYLNVYGES